MKKLAMLLLLLGVGCSDSPPTASDGGGADLSQPVGDAGMRDGASSGADASPGPGGGACKVTADCRLLSYNCNTCMCIALPTANVDPVCPGNPVSCIQDPCNHKTAECLGDMCVVQ